MSPRATALRDPNIDAKFYAHEIPTHIIECNKMLHNSNKIAERTCLLTSYTNVQNVLNQIIVYVKIKRMR